MWIGQQGCEIYKTLNCVRRESGRRSCCCTQKLEDYVKPLKNKHVARYKAHQRRQQEGETFNNFVKDLRILLMDCEFAGNNDILIDLIKSGARQPKVQLRTPFRQRSGLNLKAGDRNWKAV